MKKGLRKSIAYVLSICLIVSGIAITNGVSGATLTNVANGRNNYTFMTSNANNQTEGFCYIGNGFSAINTCNESLTNGNNMLGKTATTNEVALYVDLGADYDISSALIYQGSTNSNYKDSYCTNYSIYYSTEPVNKDNQGNITWNLAGTCTNGTIYSAAQISSAENVSSTGDNITFSETYTARSVKLVFDKDSCMGTGTGSGGTTGTVSLLSVRIYGSVPQTDEGDDTDDNNDGSTDVLFIGNSMTYYNTLCNVVKGIATAKGHTINVKAATNGGRNLIFQSTAENVLNAVREGGYEYVVIQDIVGSFDGDKLEAGAAALIETTKTYNPHAQIIFYEPWPTKDTLTGTNSLLPYFTYNYIKTARANNAMLAPAGEAFYDLYVNSGLDYYCGDNKHPQVLGTFTSAASIYYAIFDEAYDPFTSRDQSYLDEMINANVAYTNEGKQTTYNLDTLNLILQKGYQYTNAVKAAVADKSGNTKYTSIGGNYNDPDEGLNPDGLPSTQGTVVDAGLFTKANGNIAVGCAAYASSAKSAATNATDGNTGSRWESDFSDPQWLYVDLGSTKTFNKVGFIWEGAYASKYYIQVSNDASQWKTVAVVTATSVKTVQITLSELCSARYVRMYGTKRGTGYGYSFYEMGVWNDSTVEVETPTEAPTEAPTDAPTIAPTQLTTKEQVVVKVPTVKVKGAIKKKSAKSLLIKIKKVSGVKGYQIKVLKSKTAKKSIIYKVFKKNKSQFFVKSKKIKSYKKLFIKIRAYKIVNKKKVYGKWSKAKIIK